MAHRAFGDAHLRPKSSLVVFSQCGVLVVDHGIAFLIMLSMSSDLVIPRALARALASLHILTGRNTSSVMRTDSVPLFFLTLIVSSVGFPVVSAR